jgi:lipopolysaccharide transport system ATP-binding protein
MSKTVITVEELSKSYLVGHEVQRDRYTALRDVIAREARNFARKAADMLHGRQIVQGDEVEEFWALKNVSFEVNEGEVVGVIGRNGAGKSTLLKVLSRITEPTHGRVRLRGRLSSLLEVGTGFHPELTGRENIFLNGAILGMAQSEIRSKFDEIVAFAELEKFLDTPIKRYSSGMYVRLAFAVAAHLEPEILIIDEVLAVGDISFQKKCLGKMRDVANTGKTVIFVSHNMGAVGTLCQRSVYLESGRVKAIGETHDILTIYLSDNLDRSTEAENLGQLRMAGMGQKVRFSSVKLLGCNGTNVKFGEPLTYLLSIESDAKVDDASIGSSIFDQSGSCVGSLFTKETFSIGAGDTLALRLVVGDLNLAPGTYYAGFSIGYGGSDMRHDLDIVIGAPWFEVVPGAKNGNMVANWHQKWGSIVMLQANLEIENTMHGNKAPALQI